MSKKENEDFTDDMMLADVLLRIKTLENLLIAKNIFTLEEFTQEMNDISSKIAKIILQKANVPGDLDELIKSLQTGSKKVIDN